MSRRVIPGLEPPDEALEADIRSRLESVEEALEKAVGADSELLAATAVLERDGPHASECGCDECSDRLILGLEADD